MDNSGMMMDGGGYWGEEDERGGRGGSGSRHGRGKRRGHSSAYNNRRSRK